MPLHTCLDHDGLVTGAADCPACLEASTQPDGSDDQVVLLGTYWNPVAGASHWDS